MRILPSILIASVALFPALSPASAKGRKTAPPAKTEELSVRLSWLMNANQTGFVAAEEKGFYEQEGLSVVNRPGGIDFPSILLVVSGSDDIGVQSGAETIIAARANGVPIKAIAVLEQKSPFVYFSLASANIKTPKDFEGKTVEVSFGRPLEMVYRMMLAKAGADSRKIIEVKKNPSYITLLSGAVDMKPGFISDYIFAEHAAQMNDIALSAIYASDFGIRSYGYTIFATDQMIKERPDVIERYLRATLKGWRYALENPEESIDFVMKRNSHLDRAPQLKALRARKSYIMDGKSPLGAMDRAVWKSMVRSLYEQGGIKKLLDVSDVYTNEFVEKIYAEK